METLIFFCCLSLYLVVDSQRERGERERTQQIGKFDRQYIQKSLSPPGWAAFDSRAKEKNIRIRISM